MLVFMSRLITLFFCLFLLSSCEGWFMDEQKSNTPQNNFELLWQTFDERYCFFGEKDVDWDQVYIRYRSQLPTSTVTNATVEEGLFHLMSDMLLELQDGHVQISNGLKISVYDEWHTRYPSNYNENVISYHYLNSQTISVGAGMSLTPLSESVGYISCFSFSDKFNRVDFDKALAAFASCKGVIIDMRNNGGGLVSEAYALASRFVSQKTHVGYVRYKTGKGHDDFSEYFRRYVEPAGAHPFYGKVAIITNRRVYSAANLFVSVMKCLPRVRVIGDYTGGGGGLAVSTELYNGWKVELSTNPLFDIDKQSIESGIAPHQNMSLISNDRGVDNLIESAIDWIMAE